MLRYLFPLIVWLGGATVLVGLGLWQLDRLEWKEGVLEEIESRISAAPGPLPENPNEKQDRYLPVAVIGQTGAEELHVLVSDRSLGAGFRIVTSLETEAGRRILLDQGFVPDELKDAPRAPVLAEVTGNLHWPVERDSFTPDNDPSANYWYARDIDEMAERLGTEPVLLIARAFDPAREGILPLPVGTRGIPNNHLGYAVQWFGMAIVWMGMTLLFIRRISRRGTKETGAA